MARLTKDRLKRKVKGAVFRRVHSMITCAEFEAFVFDYLEGTLAAKQKRIFELHLRLCRECRDYLRAYRESVAAGKAVLSDETDTVPEAVPEDLVQAILAARSGDESDPTHRH